MKQFAREAGADLVGIARAVFDEEGLRHLQQYVEEERNGDMAYLKEVKKRVSPDSLLSGAKSVIVIAVNYYREVPDLPKGHGRVARYAYGRDYHRVLTKILKKIASYIEKIDPFAETKICVDSAPLLEKAYAVKAGLGFIGKNTTLITPEYGSFVLLGELITTLDLEPDEPKIGVCGTCTRCIDACPARAFTGPFEMDARRCISYLTIEKRGRIPEEFHAAIGDRLFGCDMCQEVCPYNKNFAKPLQLREFRELKIAGSSLDLEEILAMKSDEEYLKRFAGSPLMRAKRAGLQRNARIAARNEKASCVL